MPRRSSADLSVVGPDTTNPRLPITPVGSLSSDERAVFDHVVRTHAHLTPGDAPLLTIFSRAVAGTLRAEHALDFQRLSHTALVTATKLRLTQQAKTRPETLARMLRDGSGLSYYERMAAEEQR